MLRKDGVARALVIAYYTGTRATPLRLLRWTRDGVHGYPDFKNLHRSIRNAAMNPMPVTPDDLRFADANGKPIEITLHDRDYGDPLLYPFSRTRVLACAGAFLRLGRKHKIDSNGDLVKRHRNSP